MRICYNEGIKIIIFIFTHPGAKELRVRFKNGFAVIWNFHRAVAQGNTSEAFHRLNLLTGEEETLPAGAMKADLFDRRKGRADRRRRMKHTWKTPAVDARLREVWEPWQQELCLVRKDHRPERFFGVLFLFLTTVIVWVAVLLQGCKREAAASKQQAYRDTTVLNSLWFTM